MDRRGLCPPRGNSSGEWWSSRGVGYGTGGGPCSSQRDPPPLSTTPCIIHPPGVFFAMDSAPPSNPDIAGLLAGGKDQGNHWCHLPCIETNKVDPFQLITGSGRTRTGGGGSKRNVITKNFTSSAAAPPLPNSPTSSPTSYHSDTARTARLSCLFTAGPRRRGFSLPRHTKTHSSA